MGKVNASGLAALAAATFLGFTGQANSIGLCSCCAEPPAEACGVACAPVPKVPGQCPAVVVYDGKGQAGEAGNPLNGLSLKDLSLGNPSASEAELFRRFLEKNRRAAVRAYLAADKRYRHGKITKQEMDAAQALLNEAQVNYQHGIRAYLNRIGKKSD